MPEHAHKRVVVIRILDTISPIKCVIPDYDFYVQMPDKGQLISKRKGSSRYYPWIIDISEGSTSAVKCLRLLFPQKHNAISMQCERILLARSFKFHLLWITNRNDGVRSTCLVPIAASNSLSLLNMFIYGEEILLNYCLTNLEWLDITSRSF